jgi:PiT family inorganic phosphate transporter
VSSLDVVLLVSAALFAWSMGSHYSGAVMGAAYGAGVITLTRGLVLAAVLALVGAVTVGVGVVGTYATTLVVHPPPLYSAAALLASAVTTTASTFFRLPTSTIQIYTFATLGTAVVGGLTVHTAGFGLVIAGWVAGPVVAIGLGYLFGRLLPRVAGRSVWVMPAIVVVISAYSSFTLGSNDVSNAASSLVATHLLPPITAAGFGGVFIALGVLTWGRRLMERIGTGIVRIDLAAAASSQLAQALTLTGLNLSGYNSSINQTIVGGLLGAGLAQSSHTVNRKNVINILATWLLSPALGIAAAAVTTVLLQTVYGPPAAATR